MTGPILQIDALECHYGPVKALSGVSLSIAQGQITAILGANGAGKTTLLKTISGVLTPTQGTISLKGQSLAHMRPDQIVRAGITHVPEGREVFPLLSVDENLTLGAYTRKSKPAIATSRQLIYDYFPALAERRHQSAGTLSGGQQQMLAIGRALMADPKIMLLDEPSLGLSPRLEQEIFAIIARLNTEQNVTIVLVEQNAHAALAHAHCGYVLELGRLVLQDTAGALRNHADIKQFYLGQNTTGQTRQPVRWKRRKAWRQSP